MTGLDMATYHCLVRSSGFMERGEGRRDKEESASITDDHISQFSLIKYYELKRCFAGQ